MTGNCAALQAPADEPGMCKSILMMQKNWVFVIVTGMGQLASW